MSPLPAYVEYGSRVSAPPPVVCRQGRFLALVLKGDQGLIQAACDRILNVPAAGTVEYVVLSGSVLMLVGSFAQVTSGAPGFEDWGFVEETQLSLCVPLAAGRREGETFVSNRLCVAIPYILVDNPLSYAGGREDYGYPKAMACFSPRNGLGEQVEVKAFGGELGRGNQAEWTPLVELERVRPEAGGAPQPGPSAVAAAPGAAGPTWSGRDEIVAYLEQITARGEASPLALGVAIADLARAVMDKTARQVFLKQFRDAGFAGNACYRTIVEAPVEATEVSLSSPLCEWQVTIHPFKSHPITEELGIGSQPTPLTCELEMNMTIDPGAVVAP